MDVAKTFEEHITVVRQMLSLETDIRLAADRMCSAMRQGGKILWMGNGGSAAESQHMAAELVGRFSRERPAFASIALTTDTSILTAVGNDYGYKNVFVRQIQALCAQGDVVIGMSTSGTSENIVAGMEAAKSRGGITVALTGESGGTLKSLADICIRVPSNNTARIQEGHLLIGHMWCDYLETELLKGL